MVKLSWIRNHSSLESDAAHEGNFYQDVSVKLEHRGSTSFKDNVLRHLATQNAQLHKITLTCWKMIVKIVTMEERSILRCVYGKLGVLS